MNWFSREYSRRISNGVRCVVAENKVRLTTRSNPYLVTQKPFPMARMSTCKPCQQLLVTKQEDKARQSFALSFLCEVLHPCLKCAPCLRCGVIHCIVARLMKGRYHGALVIVMTIVIGVRAMTANTTKT